MAIIDNSGGQVVVEAGARVERTAVLIGPCTIERNAYVGHYAVVGGAPQHHGYYPSPLNGKRANSGVLINREATVREHCQIHQGILAPTIVGRDALVMAGSCINHDCVVGEGSTLATNTILGGHTTIAENVTFGQGVVTHPWVIIGEHAMIGLNSSIIKDVLPYQKVAGSPARLIGKNTGPGGDKGEWTYDELSHIVLEHWDALLEQRIEEREWMKELKK